MQPTCGTAQPPPPQVTGLGNDVEIERDTRHWPLQGAWMTTPPRFSDGCDGLFSRAAEGVHHDLAVAVQPLQSFEFPSASLTVLPPSSSPPQMQAPTPEAYPGRLASRNEDQLAILRDMLDSDTDEHDCEPAGNSADTIPSRQPGWRWRYLAVVLRSALTVRTHTQTASKPPARAGGYQLVFKGIWAQQSLPIARSDSSSF
ncbi:unnamed protein product [Phytophthora lilii]|uniref:Unnamed protein product n=1 Tax=Phytophthora lilii TaxID=2077276 RepID=A0A9W6TLI9_9STRA|nr:unnamed protein product [Phytophthora lilii]